MRSFRPMVLLAVAFWLLAAPASSGQTREQDPRQPGQPGQLDAIRVETSLVTVPVIVTDHAGRFVTGLARNDFQY